MKVIESRRRRLNVKLIITMFLVGVMVWVCISWWHTRQVRISSKQLLERGMAAKEAGNHNLAVEELGRYVGLAPDDTDALAEYTDSLYQVGSTRELREQVFALNEEVLRRKPKEMKIRAVQAEIALDLSRIPDAASHVDIVEEYEPLTSRLWYVRGRCFEEARETDKAIESYKAALRLDRDHAEATEHLAELLATQKDDQKGADALLTSLVERTGSVDALLLRARRHAQADQQMAAIADLRAAVLLAPDNSVAVSAFGAAVHRLMNTETRAREELTELRDEAIVALRNRIANDPENTPMRLYFARLLWMDDEDRDEAIAVLRSGHELDPSDETLLFSLADSLISDGQLDEVGPLLSRFSDHIDSVHKRSFLRARMLMAREKWEHASTTLAELVGSVPRDRQLLNRARLYEAACLQQLEEVTAAANSFEKTLRDNPSSTVARLGLAESYLRNNQIASAINEYRRLKLIPRVASFLADLLIEAQTTELAEPGRWDEIAELVGVDTGSVPDTVERAILRADMQFAANRTKEAWATLLRCAQENPDSQEASLAVDMATSLLLDRVMETLSKTLYDPEANAGFELVAAYWATRGDNEQLTAYFEEPINATGERRELLHRMTLSMFVASRLATRIGSLGGDSSKLRQYAGELSQRLVKADPACLGQRIQLLAYFAQKPTLFAELEAAKAEFVGLAISQAVPWFYGDNAGLSRLENLAANRLRSQPSSVELLNAQALIHSAKGNYDAATVAWRNLHQQAPSDVRVARNLVLILAIHGNDFEESGRIIESALADSPGDVTLVHAKACVKIAEGDLNEAGKIARSVTSQNVHLPYLVHLSYIQASQSRTGEAKFTLGRIGSATIAAQGLHPLDRLILQRLQDALGK